MYHLLDKYVYGEVVECHTHIVYIYFVYHCLKFYCVDCNVILMNELIMTPYYQPQSFFLVYILGQFSILQGATVGVESITSVLCVMQIRFYGLFTLQFVIQIVLCYTV